MICVHIQTASSDFRFTTKFWMPAFWETLISTLFFTEPSISLIEGINDSDKDISACFFNVNVECEGGEWAADHMPLWLYVTVASSSAVRDSSHNPPTVKKHRWDMDLNPSIIQSFGSLTSFGFLGVLLNLWGNRSKEVRFASVVAVHVEEERIPGNDLENVGQPWRSAAHE